MPEDRFGDLLTRTITRVRRVNYALPDGSRFEREGPIEITFDGGSTVRLESGSDGESLRLRVGRWVDPFGDPLSPQNRRFIQESGKWTAFDVSKDDGYCLLIGQHIQNVTIIGSATKIVGVELTIGRAVLKAEVRADELLVDLLLGAVG